MDVIERIFTTYMLSPQLFVKNSYTDFHENPTYRLAAETSSQMDGRKDAVSTQYLIFSLHKKTPNSQWTFDHTTRTYAGLTTYWPMALACHMLDCVCYMSSDLNVHAKPVELRVSGNGKRAPFTRS